MFACQLFQTRLSNSRNGAKHSSATIYRHVSELLHTCRQFEEGTGLGAICDQSFAFSFLFDHVHLLFLILLYKTDTFTIAHARSSGKGGQNVNKGKY